MRTDTADEAPKESTPAIRRIPIWAYVAIVVVYLAVIQGLGYLATRGDDTEYATFQSTSDVWKHLVLPVGVGLVLVIGVVAALGWWRPVLVDDRPVRRWLWIVPALLMLAVLAGTYYSGLADKGLAFTLSLLFGAMLIGFGEEGMFRGIGVTAFRANGYSEAKVALWTSVIFGLAHATNIFQEGAGAIVQVLVTAVAGYFFYIVRRVSGGLALAAIVHGLWDFGLISGTVIEDHFYVVTGVFILTDIALVLILLLRRRSIEPSRQVAPVAALGTT